MSKKVLLVATVSGFIPQFELNNVKILLDKGYEIHYASNFQNPHYGNDNSKIEKMPIILHQVDFVRSPLRVSQNIQAYKQLKKILQKEKFDFVHCHTPIASFLTRVIAHFDNKIPVIYTAHGFHFYKGAPLVNWLIYYPVERFLAYWTKILLVINNEDLMIAKKWKTVTVFKVPGPGLELNKFDCENFDKNAFRASLNITMDQVVLISVGELNNNKNQEVILKALGKLQNKDIHLVLCGDGNKMIKLKKLAMKLKISSQVHFMGYCTNVIPYLKSADIYISSSKREGLGMAALEAMALGLPIIASDTRGTREFLFNGVNGIVCKKNKSCYYITAIQKMLYTSDRNIMRKNSLEIVKKFDVLICDTIMKKVYASIKDETIKEGKIIGKNKSFSNNGSL